MLCAAGPFSRDVEANRGRLSPQSRSLPRHHRRNRRLRGPRRAETPKLGREALCCCPESASTSCRATSLQRILKRRLPDANDLKLYLSLGVDMSRGTAKNHDRGNCGWHAHALQGPNCLLAIARRWGHAISERVRSRPSRSVGATSRLRSIRPAFPTSIDVHFEASPAIRAFARTPTDFIKSFLGLDPVQRLLQSQIDRLPEGPSEANRRAGQAVLVGQARNDEGQTVRSRVRTPEGYSLTAATAFDAACRLIAGEITPGFQTPSRAFGADYILSFDGVVREDLNR